MAPWARQERGLALRENPAQAQAFSDNDPYTLAGLFQSRDVRPMKVTFGSLP